MGQVMRWRLNVTVECEQQTPEFKLTLLLFLYLNFIDPDESAATASGVANSLAPELQCTSRLLLLCEFDKF